MTNTLLTPEQITEIRDEACQFVDAALAAWAGVSMTLRKVKTVGDVWVFDPPGWKHGAALFADDFIMQAFVWEARGREWSPLDRAILEFKIPVEGVRGPFMDDLRRNGEWKNLRFRGTVTEPALYLVDSGRPTEAMTISLEQTRDQAIEAVLNFLLPLHDAQQLALWQEVQRVDYWAGDLEEAKIRKLESLPGWDWLWPIRNGEVARNWASLFPGGQK